MFLKKCRYGIENCQIVWAIKDTSIGATFFDAGAAKFFLPCLNETKQEESVPCKRLNYELEGGYSSNYVFNLTVVFLYCLQIVPV